MFYDMPEIQTDNEIKTGNRCCSYWRASVEYFSGITPSDTYRLASRIESSFPGSTSIKLRHIVSNYQGILRWKMGFISQDTAGDLLSAAASERQAARLLCRQFDMVFR